jgi:hypothetical protein
MTMQIYFTYFLSFVMLFLLIPHVNKAYAEDKGQKKYKHDPIGCVLVLLASGYFLTFAIAEGDTPLAWINSVAVVLAGALLLSFGLSSRNKNPKTEPEPEL